MTKDEIRRLKEIRERHEKVRETLRGIFGDKLDDDPVMTDVPWLLEMVESLDTALDIAEGQGL